MSQKPKGRSLPKMLRYVTVAAMLAMPGISGAQIVVPPSIPDTLINNTANSTLCNNAIYDYVPGSKQLKVTAIDNPAGAVIHFDDGISAIDQTLPIPPGGISVAYFPDVAIGDGTSATSAYVAAVYDIETSTFPSWSRIYLQGYNVTGLGTGSMTVTAVGAPVAVSNANTLAGPSHIDIAADYSTTSPVGVATCQKFAITWGDWDAGANGGIWAADGKLPNNITAAPVQVYAPNPTAPTKYFPDISAVFRSSSATRPFAEIVFGMLNATDPLEYAEYDFNTGVPAAPTIIVASGMYWKPRIAGIDDYQFNNPGAGNMYEYIVDFPITSQFFTGYYRNNTGAFSSTPFIPSPNDTNFAVTVGADAKTYSIMFHPDYNSSFLLKPLWNTGVPTGWPSSASLYRVNTSSPSVFQVALDASCNDNCNNNQAAVLASWNAGSTSGIFEKSILSPVAHFRTTNVINISGEGLFTASPNPASSYLVLGVPGNYNNDCTYGLIDMAGRVVAQQPITQPNQQINIAELPKGMYLLNIYSGTSLQQSSKIVKR